MKKLLVSEITHKIYLGDAKDLGDDNYEMTGKKEDFTDEAIRAVFEWFMYNHKENEPAEAFEIKFRNQPYVLQMVKREGKEAKE